MKNRISDLLVRFAAGLWSIFALVISVLLLFGNAMGYSYTHYEYDSNVLLAAIGIAAVAFICALYRRFGEKIDALAERAPKYTVLILCAIIFILQVITFINAYFEPMLVGMGLDSGKVVETAKALAFGRDASTYVDYFSTYPNNLFITRFFMTVFMIAPYLGLYPVNAAIIIQCAINTLTGWLLFGVVKKMTKPSVAYFAFLIYVIHVSFSPWTAFLYSDALGLCLPLLIIYIYQSTRDSKDLLLKWFLIGVIGYFGFKLKPQIIVALIAVVIAELVELIAHADKAMLKERAKGYCSLAMSLILSAVLISAVIFPSIDLDTDKNGAVGPAHYIMMGLNQPNNGGYLESDLQFSLSKETPEERTAANIEVIKQRLSDMGVGGFADHLARKTVAVYGDGAYYAYHLYFIHNIDRTNNVDNPAKQLYYGEGFDIYAAVKQTVWLTLILSSVGVFLYFIFSNKRDAVLLAMVVSIIGLTLFQLIFESGAKYLYIYSPFYIVLAIFGVKGYFEAFGRLLSKRAEKNAKGEA